MRRDVELLLLKLADGGRILRFSDPRSGLSLEKRHESEESVARQKRRWMRVFLALLDRQSGPAN
jgi:hypothetical protein